MRLLWTLCDPSLDNMRKLQVSIVILFLLVPGFAMATGIGLPDLGPAMNWIVYGGLIFVPVVVPVVCGILLSRKSKKEEFPNNGKMKLSKNYFLTSLVLLAVAVFLLAAFREISLALYVFSGLSGALGMVSFSKATSASTWLVVLRVFSVLIPLTFFVVLIRLYAQSDDIISRANKNA